MTSSRLGLSKERTQNDYDQCFMIRCQRVAKETDDPKYRVEKKAAVGAIITVNNEIAVESANKVPPALEGRIKFGGPSDPDRYVFIEHAERAAIYTALRNLKRITGGTMYCTRFPCVDCARAIIFSGISRLVVEKGFSGEGLWIESQRNALRMLRRADVIVRYLSQRAVGTEVGVRR